jgi:mannose-6-phosphate isomerase-like protein (cupin superfamily)
MGKGALIISAATAEHYVWGDGADGWHLVRAPGLSVIQERMPPGTAEQRHRHAVARQFFFVLAGRLLIEVEGVQHNLETRDGLEVAPGMAHEVRNNSASPAEFLVISQPPSHGDRINVASERSATSG